MQVILVLGARPQFIKAAPLSAALSAAGIGVRILHTGQHYDHEMSGAFFDELGLMPPQWNLECGGGSHGAMTGAMLSGIETVLVTERPDAVVVVGDTNSTLAGALAAAKLHIPVAHVEAGLRSGNRRMPEELNRICTDHLSDLLFCSSESGRTQLAAEGITRGVHVTGDVMADVFFTTLEKVRARRDPPPRPVPAPDKWALMTLHRPENTDAPDRLRAIFAALGSSGIPVVFPMHPRVALATKAAGLTPPPNVRCSDPAAYGELVALLDACSLVLTDSGGLQKEAYWAGKPCITLRDETEWTELVAFGWNVVTGASEDAILAAIQSPSRPESHPPLYGDGRAAVRIAELVAGFLRDSGRTDLEPRAQVA
jgi:UDP-N-acetylglucosamine 2-epimerase